MFPILIRRPSNLYVAFLETSQTVLKKNYFFSRTFAWAIAMKVFKIKEGGHIFLAWRQCLSSNLKFEFLLGLAGLHEGLLATWKSSDQNWRDNIKYFCIPSLSWPILGLLREHIHGWHGRTKHFRELILCSFNQGGRRWVSLWSVVFDQKSILSSNNARF